MKRYEFLVKRERALEHSRKREAESLTNWVHQEHRKGVLSPECYYSLVDQMNEATEREWEATVRVERVKSNLRRSHVAYCRIRMNAGMSVYPSSFVTYREALALAPKSPQVVSEIHSPELELIENSLPSHAPPLEPRFQNGTGSS